MASYTYYGQTTSTNYSVTVPIDVPKPGTNINKLILTFPFKASGSGKLLSYFYFDNDKSNPTYLIGEASQKAQGFEWGVGDGSFTKSVTLSNHEPFSRVNLVMATNYSSKTLQVINPSVKMEFNTDISISSLAPNGGTFPISRNKVFSWTISTPGLLTSQNLYYKKATDSNWKTVSVNTGVRSYTFGANSFEYGIYYEWYVEAKDNFGNNIKSQTATASFGQLPKTSISSPDSVIKRSVQNTFQWTYSDGLGLYQKAWEIGFKLASEVNWTTVSESNTNTSYTFDANYFQNAKYNLRIRVKNEDNLWSDYVVKDFQAGPVPSLTISEPSNNATFRRVQNNYIKWKISDSLNTGQKAYEYRYRVYNSTTWVTESQTTSNTQKLIAENSLEPNKYVWQLRVQNNDNIWTEWSEERQFTYGYVSTLTVLSPDDGSNVRLTQDLIITWSSTNSINLPQANFELGYKIKNSSVWTTVTGTTAESYTINHTLLTYDYYDFRLKIKNTDNAWTDYSLFTLKVGSTPTLSATYPVEVNIKRDIQQIFTWELNDALVTGQKSYELGVREQGTTDWTTFTDTTSAEYKTFIANYFEAGDYEWRVKVTNNDGISTDYVQVKFGVIGQTNAPVITQVTKSAIPTIKWSVDSQDTFEFELFSKGERIYSSGVQKGANIRQYTPNIMIPDGNYIIKIRCMNEYGYFTDWMTYSFVLSTIKPDALDCYIYANNNYGVNVVRSLELDAVADSIINEESTIPSAIYVLRREAGKGNFEIIGNLSVKNTTQPFVDNTVTKNIEYEYALRNYKGDAGYTDSDSHLIKINHKGVIVYNGDDFVNLTLSEKEQFDITHTPSKSFTYSQMIGRTYPVKESSEWMTHNTSFSAFCTFAQYDKLQSMLASNNDLWFKGKDFSFAASIDSISIKATQYDRGYDIDVTVSRINEEEFALF